MSRIKFNIKYRPQIENGEYRVETRIGHPIDIVCWNMEDTSNKGKKFNILGLLQNEDGTFQPAYFAEDGTFLKAEQSPMDLFIVVDNLPDIPAKLASELDSLITYCIRQDGDIEDERTFIARETKLIWKTICDWLGEQDKLINLLQTEEALKDIPKWQKLYSGAGGNGDGKNAFLIKDGFGYRLSPVITAGDEYINLSELERLPKLG